MVLTLVRQDRVVLCCDVVGQVVVQDKPEKTVEERQINLLVDFGQYSLYHDNAFAIARFPYVVQIVDALALFVDEKRRGLGVG